MSDLEGSPSKQARQFWPGSNHAVRLYLADNTEENCGDNTAYWEFYKMFFGSFGGLNVDVTSNNPVQFSCNMEFNAFPGCTPGHICYHAAGEGDPLYLVNMRPSNAEKLTIDWDPEEKVTQSSGTSTSSTEVW